MRRLIFTVGLVALSGCATLNEDECLTADWRTIGFQDGVAGHTPDRLGQHRKACAKYGVTPNLDTYLEGRSQGLVTYCTPQNGFNAGAAGRSYKGVCPAELENEFLPAYNDGHGLYTREHALSDVLSDISHSESRLEEIHKEIAEKEALLVEAAGTPGERSKLVDELHALAEEQGGLHQKIRDLEYRHGELEADLEAYREDISHRYGYNY